MERGESDLWLPFPHSLAPKGVPGGGGGERLAVGGEPPIPSRGLATPGLQEPTGGAKGGSFEH